MDFEYSKTMKKLMKQQPGILVQVIMILIMCVLVVGSIYGYKSGKESNKNLKQNMEKFNPINNDITYSTMTPAYLSEEFASNYDDSIYFFIALDDELYPYILAVDAKDMDQYEKLIDYTYDDSAEAPAAVTMQGMPVEIDDDLIDMAVDAYNAFMGSEVVDETTFSDYFGYYYLDTTQDPKADYSFMSWCLLLFVVMSAIYLYIMVSANTTSKRRQITLDKFSNNMLLAVDKEMNEPSTVSFKQQKLYLTHNYIISNIHGFDIIPCDEIIHVYGVIYGKNKKSLIIVTKDGVKHEIAVIFGRKNTAVEITEQINQILPDIKYGFEQGFYTYAGPNFKVDAYPQGDGIEVKSNMLLGILGAILGSVLGGVIWIILGKIGIIAGLAGFAMMYFAIQGYRKFSGFLDKKGQIISLIIAFVMILVANYTLYVIEYYEYFSTGSFNIMELINSFKKLPGLLTWSGAWGDFAKDLGIGYLLSIWAGIDIIKSTFSSRKS